MGLLKHAINLVLKAGPEFFRERRRQEMLRRMLVEQRFQFRSTEELMKGIAADRPTTERLLHSIGAQRSDDSDEWTFQKRPGTK